MDKSVEFCAEATTNKKKKKKSADGYGRYRIIISYFLLSYERRSIISKEAPRCSAFTEEIHFELF